MKSNPLHTTAIRPSIRLLICDLDNTLYDWVTFFALSFEAMVTAAVTELCIDREELLDELREIHQRYHNSEHPFALMEAPSVQARVGPMSRPDMLERLQPVFRAFNETRDRELHLYPGVLDTLKHVRRVGTPIVGHTEATVPNASSRLRRLGIADLFEALYAVSPDSAPHPDPSRPILPPPYRVRYLGQDERKPNPSVLLDICRDLQVHQSEALYVGDSIARDIGMARVAGVWSAWAKYGQSYLSENWEKLVRVTHWNTEDVNRARQANILFGSSEPNFVLDRGFDEILNHVQFMPRISGVQS